jgi:hypothetical protein
MSETRALAFYAAVLGLIPLVLLVMVVQERLLGSVQEETDDPKRKAHDLVTDEILVIVFSTAAMVASLVGFHTGPNKLIDTILIACLIVILPAFSWSLLRRSSQELARYGGHPLRVLILYIPLSLLILVGVTWLLLHWS